MQASPVNSGVVSRRMAAQVLGVVFERGRSLKMALASALPCMEDPRDRALTEALCFAVLRRHPTYEMALGQWLRRPLQSRDAELKALLMVGFAQLDVLQLPAHAALSATVDTCRALGRAHQAGMVNALLRRAQREGFPRVPADAGWPRWLYAQVCMDWGAQAEAVFAASVQPGPMWLRVNRRVATPDGYVARLFQAGIDACVTPLFADAVRLSGALPVAQLPGFADGVVSVQDGSAQQVADALLLADNARVLDACAAPGGKAAHLLERHSGLQLTALDVDARRLEQVAQTLRRTVPGAAAALHVADAAMLPAWWNGQPFDAVLLDAPCSATGVVRRQPDVLLHRRPEDITALCALQARLLDATWRTLRPGGVLLYTTCSVLACENQHQVEAFLRRTPDACAQPLDKCFGLAVGAGRQRLPGEQQCDGFFYALLLKNPAV